MKNLAFIFLAVLITATGCKKFTDLLTFEISNSENIKIPATSLISTPIISPVPVSMHSQETFESNNTKASLVKDVTLRKLTLTITDPSSETFNFLKSINIFIGTDPNDKVLLATLDNVPLDVLTIDLVPGNSKLDKYIKASSYTLYTEISLRSTVGKELTVRADSKFKVTADPL